MKGLVVGGECWVFEAPESTEFGRIKISDRLVWDLQRWYWYVVRHS